MWTRVIRLPAAHHGYAPTRHRPGPVRSRRRPDPAVGQIVAEFFDLGQSRSLPWKRRPQAALLLEALKDPGRGFGAVVIGEPHRAFYGNQFSLTFPLFEHYGGAVVVARSRRRSGPGERGARPGDVRVRRDVQRRAEPDQDPGPLGDAGPGQGRRPLPRRPATVWVPAGRCRAASQPGQGRRRQTAARAGTGPGHHCGNFRSSAPHPLRVFLRQQAQACLTRHGITEPVAWEPPPHWVTRASWPGTEPGHIPAGNLTPLLEAGRSAQDAAAAAGLTAEHVRLWCEITGTGAPVTAAEGTVSQNPRRHPRSCPAT